MRIATVVGTRPQLIKAAALQPSLRDLHQETFIDTGQHWDDAMAGAFFGELGLARPDHSLGIGGGGQADQVGRMLIALERVLEAERPDVLLVFGDTNSTLAGALAAAKLRIPLAHVEAGLRSFDRRMPEEVNRVVVDHLSNWLFAPTPTAVANLAAEGIVSGVAQVGDLMQDLAARVAGEVRDPVVLEKIAEQLTASSARSSASAVKSSASAVRISSSTLSLALHPGGYLLATVHRAENREPEALRAWTALLAAVASPERPVVLALHPGTRAALERANLVLPASILVVEPQGYRTTLALQLHAAAVLTDSGGIQREAAWLGVPCLVLRGTTEWVEAVAQSGGRMVVVGLDAGRAVAELARLTSPVGGPQDAMVRSERLHLAPSGAARAIAARLGGLPG